MNIKMSRRWLLSISVTLAMLVLLWVISTVMAQGPQPKGNAQPQEGLSLASDVNSRISYQGLLKESGQPVTGSRDMTFRLYSDDTCSTQVGSDIVKSGVSVSDGLFTVELDVDQSHFNGQALWLRVQVDSTQLGCEEILPVPYALSLRPGASINTSTGSAVRGYSDGGMALFGYSEDGYAVYAVDDGTTQGKGYAGYFASTSGIPVFGYSSAESYWNNQYAPGVYGRSTNGVGVYGLSDSSISWMAGVQGESTNGPGVVGSSTDSHGVYGTSTDKYGVSGYSTNDYAGYFYSSNYRGLYASSHQNFYAGRFENRGGSTKPGLYVDGNFIATGSKTGYVVEICLNEGPEPLETGDVVVVTGYGEPVAGEIPLVRVRKATEAESTGVVGVVDQPFTVETSPDDEGGSVPKPAGGVARITSGTAISPGDYLSVVTLGSFKAIKVDASYGAIQPGDLLVSSPNPGYAMRVEDPRIGTVIGKALGPLDEGTGVLPVLVTLQ